MEQLILNIVATVNIWTLYPSNHPRIAKMVEQLLESLHALLAELNRDAVTFLVVGDDLVVEGEVVRKTTLSHLQFVGNLKQRDIERLTLAGGIDAEEATSFVAALATGAFLESSDHVIYGRVDMSMTEDKNKVENKQLTSEHVDVVREAFAQFRTNNSLPLGAIEQLVWGMVDALSRTTRTVLPLAKLREHDEYTFVHSVNVSMLVMAQARSFGIQGPMLHSFGVASLLHDIGKLMVPLTVLNKPGKLEEDDWRVMQGHAEQGAWYLSSIGNSSELAILVAYEHHLRYDMKPAYPILRKPRRPNLISRMTSVADAYDAMSTVRPYQKPLMRTAALDILARRADSFYDPLLVANFTRMVQDMT